MTLVLRDCMLKVACRQSLLWLARRCRRWRREGRGGLGRRGRGWAGIAARGLGGRGGFGWCDGRPAGWRGHELRCRIGRRRDHEGRGLIVVLGKSEEHDEEKAQADEQRQRHGRAIIARYGS